MRADLHVHSYHSGYASHLKFLRARDCYSDPSAIYRTAKARGMDLVAITDHDSIDGCLELLDRHAGAGDADFDFIMGEEVECVLPARTGSARNGPGLRLHIGVLGITERIHRDLQPLRGNAFELVAYLRQQDVFFGLNHLFFFYDAARLPLAEYLEAVVGLFPAFETRNGAMLDVHNALIEELVDEVPTYGGSDAHTLADVGRTWTEAPGRTREEFLASLKSGLGRVGGAHGTARRVAREIYTVIGAYCAGLVGLARHELTARERALGLAFAAASLPVQFLPALIALAHKSRERATIARCLSTLESLSWNVASPLRASGS